MLFQKAMRYYRLWIYTCNAVLLLGVIVFVVTAGSVLGDTRSRFVPVPMYHPTFIYAYLALVAQGGLLQAVGCYGALRLNEKWLNIYWLAMLVLLVGDVVVGVVWIFLFSNLTHNLPNQLWSRLQSDYGYDQYFTMDWNDIQQELRCCGVHGPRDYNTTKWALSNWAASPPSTNSSVPLVPISCSLFIYEQHSTTTNILEEMNSLPSENLDSLLPSISVSVSVSVENLTSSYSRGEEPYSVTSSSSSSSSSSPVPTLSLQSSQHSEDIARQGCARLIQEWMQHCANVLFVLGYCVIAFLKLCFLGILRYEIKEMIQKIKVLQGELPAFPDLMSLGSLGMNSPETQQKNHVDTSELVMMNSTGHHPNHLNSISHTDPATSHLLDKKKGRSNGNNNDLELTELVMRNAS